MINIVLSHRVIITNYNEEERKVLIHFCNTIALEQQEASQYSYDQSPILFQFFHIGTSQIEVYRGLYQDLIITLNQKGIVFTAREEYQDNPKLNVVSKITSLRPYQKEIDVITREKTSGYILVPTGGGKTVVMINEILRKWEKTIVLVHNKKLLYQFIERVMKFTSLTEHEIGIYGDSKKEQKPVTVALMQSFGKMSPIEIQNVTREYDLFMIDEAHHLTAATFFKIASNVKSRRLYWLTATPDKSEGLSLIFMEKVLGPLIYRVTEEQLQSEGIILRPQLIPIVNEDSFIWDMYQSGYTLEPWVSDLRYHSSQFLQNSIPFQEQYIDASKATVVICKNQKELNLLYAGIQEQSLKNKIKIIPAPLYKTHSKYLTPGTITFALEIPPEKRKVDMNKIKEGIYFRPNRTQLVTNCIAHEFKTNRNKNPYILVLSDRIEHTEFMYNSLPPILKDYAVIFHWGLGKKDQEEREKLIDSKKIRIIFSIDKFVGEGWDKEFLDVLILTHTLKDHEGVKQYVGRVIRSSEGKVAATVYDIVDINCGVTRNQFKQRFENYYKKQSYYDENEIYKILNRR